MDTSASPQLRPGTEAFFFKRGPVGVLLVHGYSGSPGELRLFGEALAKRDFSVAAPLLTGHGSTPDAMFQVTWREWVTSAISSLAHLRAECRNLVIAGFSMGALIATVIAARVPADGVILMAPAFRLRGQPVVELADIAGRLKPWYYPLARADFANPAVREAVRGFAPEIDLDNPEVVEAVRKNAKVPIASIYELVRLQRRARRDLTYITAPALIMQGRHDRTVNPASAEEALRRIGSSDKQLIWFEHSDHQLTREREKELVWETVGAWIAARVQNSELKVQN